MNCIREKEKSVKAAALLRLSREKYRLQFDQSSTPCISITSPLLLESEQKTWWVLPQAAEHQWQKLHPFSSLAFLIHALTRHDLIHYIETGEMTTHSGLLLSLNPSHSSHRVCLMQSKSDVDAFLISLLLPLWPEQRFLLLMPCKYTKSTTVFNRVKPVQLFRDVFCTLICFALSSVCIFFF